MLVVLCLVLPVSRGLMRERTRVTLHKHHARGQVRWVAIFHYTLTDDGDNRMRWSNSTPPASTTTSRSSTARHAILKRTTLA